MRLLVVFLISAASTISSAPEEAERRIVRDWRARLAELGDLEGKFRGSLVGASLSDLGKLAFIFEQAGGISRRGLHENDRGFVYAAVDGQPGGELERNLPAIINYVKLSVTARPMVAYARSRRPWIGPRYGMATLLEVDAAISDFRSREYARVTKGELLPACVLTKSNLGSLGEANTYRGLWRAFRQGEDYYHLLNDLASYAFFVGGLAVLSVTTVVLRRRSAAAYRVPSLLASSLRRRPPLYCE